MADYDLLVLGAGATGLAAARTGRRAGARVGLVEAERPGGDCTFYGCVPSKALLETARRVAAARSGATHGFAAEVRVDFAAVMKRVHATVTEVSQDESPGVLEAEGLDLLTGRASFLDPRTLEVAGRRMTAEHVVLATGAGPLVPPIPGLTDVDYLTNCNVFDLTELPEHLLVLGGGAIGVELAQAFGRLGSRVTVVEALPRILVKEEPEAAEVVTAALRGDDIEVRTGAAVKRVSGGPTLHLSDGTTVSGSHLLVAVGRRPATSGLALDRAGVAVGKAGQVVVNRYLQTSAGHIYAAGDCTTPLQFTHVGDEQGRLAARNALASGRRWGRRGAWDDSVVPWVTFTEPEVGRVGMSEVEAFAAYGEQASVAFLPMSAVDRARCAGDTDGFVKLIAAPRRVVGPVAQRLGGRAAAVGSGRVVGMTVVCPVAGELVAEAALAMRTGALAGRLAQTIHAYPTWSLAVRMAAAQWFGGHGGRAARPARPGG